MPEAVIVATARSPIGRAFKGSLVDVRPDDLAATVVQAAAGQGARARPGHPRRPDARLRRARAAKQGVNMARRVAVALGLRRPRPAPRSTGSAPRRVQTTRMAFHAIKAGEGRRVRLRRRRVRHRTTRRSTAPAAAPRSS